MPRRGILFGIGGVAGLQPSGPGHLGHSKEVVTPLAYLDSTLCHGRGRWPLAVVALEGLPNAVALGGLACGQGARVDARRSRRQATQQLPIARIAPRFHVLRFQVGRNRPGRTRISVRAARCTLPRRTYGLGRRDSRSHVKHDPRSRSWQPEQPVRRRFTPRFQLQRPPVARHAHLAGAGCR